MTQFRGLSPDRFTLSKKVRGNRSRKGKRSGVYSGPVSASALPAPDLPLALSGSHTAILHDTGVGFTIVANEASAEQEHVLPVEPGGMMGLHREALTPLARSLTVRVTLEREGSPVKVICASRELGSRGIILTLPCKLDLRPGMAFDMEVFLPPANRPVSTHATVRSVSRTTGEDAVRYKVEVDFDKLTGSAEREIDSFVHLSKSQERPPGRA